MLYVGGGDYAPKDDLNKIDVKEDEEEILQCIHMQVDEAMVEKAESKRDESKEMNLRDQVELLKTCSLFREREKLSAKLGDLTIRGGREDELREELCKSRENVERAEVAREQLREFYVERCRVKVGTGREANKEECTRLKEEYFR